jgi:subfamily B ATP-binding cassette protein MsbA
MASYERIQTILDENTVDFNEAGLKKINFESSLQLENISFRYENSESESVKNLSFHFEKGKKYALVGQSGAGKSTLIDLILGFYQPTSGHIKIDGLDIRKFSLESYRALFGLVTQEALLFNDTVDNNLSFDQLDTTMANQALKIGNATDFSKRLGNQLIGERGGVLSGGEKQRLTIARVAYRNPEIVLLDEATSALDSQNEAEVQKALDILLKNKTSIIIAHRLSTVKNADCIILMNQGEILATGTHETLYAENTKYKNMVDLQSLG